MILSEDILALSKMFAEGSEPSSHIHETNMPMLILYAQYIYCIFVAWILYTVAQLFKPNGMINWERLRLSLSLFVLKIIVCKDIWNGIYFMQYVLITK